jgi:hypothetical protein
MFDSLMPGLIHILTLMLAVALLLLAIAAVWKE